MKQRKSNRKKGLEPHQYQVSWIIIIISIVIYFFVGLLLGFYLLPSGAVLAKPIIKASTLPITHP